MNDELNMILKAKVVKLKVELDIKGSKLPTQVNNITKFLQNKPVKLRVELTATIRELNAQMAKIKARVASAPIKLKVDLDAKGVGNVKTSLDNVSKSVDKFNKTYAKQAKTMSASKEKIKKAMTIENVPSSGAVGNYNNIKKYANQLKEVERIMRSKVPAGTDGLFSTTVLKDAQGNMKSFVATLKTADGVVEKVRYKWNAEADKFTPVNRQTVTATQAGVTAIKRAIHDLTMARDKDYEMLKNTTRRGQYDQMIKDVRTYKMSIQDARLEAKKMGDEIKTAIRKSAGINQSIVGDGKAGSANALKLRDMYSAGDLAGIQRYIEGVKGVGIQSIVTSEKVDKLGRSITEMKVKMAGTGKQVQTYTMQLNTANGVLRQIGAGSLDFNNNRNLGVFEQLAIAMKRVPVWMTAMTAFYGSIRAVGSAMREILEVDKALTEIRRVASDNINIDTMFEGSVRMSKELGNNVHDILASVGELARTFGEFNERQLLAITRTATLMSNVSDLNAEEATNTLVGTMNAFNIEAEESIRIVDALNEVDNNYAISTKQLAEGLQKTASTARTFGVSMEESVGHITAIGSVTMESGKLIGNSLKTIYSRTTTLNASREILQSVGVAVGEIGENGMEVRPVNDILKDLSVRWWDLSDAQRQQIAVTVAGRYQLSRFLALMNNYEVATDAATTAVFSQGSAMRENAEYMKSFEARINQLKNGWSELALAIGDAVLTSAMMEVIRLLTGLAGMAVKVADTFGVLPIVMGAIVAIMLKMGVFKKLVGTMTTGMTAMHLAFTETGARSTTMGTAMARAGAVGGAGMTGLGIRISAMAATAKKGFASALLAVRTFSVGLQTVLASTGVLLGFVALGIAIEKLLKIYNTKKEKETELIKLNDKMVRSYRNHRDGMDGLVDRYAELNDMTSRSTEEEQEYLNIQKTLAEQLPTTVAYIDANGKAHMKSTSEIQRELESVKALSKAQAELTSAKFYSDMEKKSKAYMKIIDNVEKLNETQKMLYENDGKNAWFNGNAGVDNMNLLNPTIDNTEQIQQNKVDILMAEAEKTEAIQKTIGAIQGQAMAYFEAGNKMVGLGDEQQAVIEKFISYNESMLRHADTPEKFEKAYKDLFNIGVQVGEVFVEAYDIMAKDIGTDDPLALNDLRKSLGDVAKAIPNTFFELTDSMGKPKKSMEELTSGLEEIVNVSNRVAKGDSNWDRLKTDLQKAGLTAKESEQYIAGLAREHQNAELRAKAQAKGVEEASESLEDLNEKAMEAIDLHAALFGVGTAEIEGVKSYLQLLHLIEDTQGRAGKATEEYVSAQFALSDFLGVTVDELDKNKDMYYEIADALTKLKFEDYNSSMSWKKFIESSDISDSQKKVLLAWDGTSKIITGEKEEIVEANSAIAKSTGEIKDIFTEKITSNAVSGAVMETKKAAEDNGWMSTFRKNLKGMFDFSDDLSFFDAGKNLVKQVTDGFESSQSKSLSESAVGRLYKWTKDAYYSHKDDVIKWGQDTAQKISEGIESNQSKTFADTSIGKLVSWIEKSWDPAKEKFLTWGRESVEELAKGFEQPEGKAFTESALGKLVNWIDEKLSPVKERFLAWGEGVVENIAKGIENNRSKTFMDSAVGKLVAWIGESWKPASEKFLAWGEEVVEDISQGIENHQSKTFTDSAVGKLVSWIEEKFTDAEEDSFGWGGSLSERISKGIESHQSRTFAESAVGRLITWIQEAFKPAEEGSFGLGGKFVEGIGKGIEDGQSKEFTDSAVGKLVAWIKEKWTFDLDEFGMGKGVSEGIAKGLASDESKTFADSAAGKLVQWIKDAFNSDFETLGFGTAEEIAKGITSDESKTFANSAVGQFVAWIKETYNTDGETLGLKTAEEITKGLTSDESKTFANSAVGQFVAWIKETYKTDGETMGLKTAEEVMKGITSDEAKTFTDSAVGKFVTWIQNAFKPDGEGMGKDTSENIAKGIESEDSKKFADSAIGKFVQWIKDGYDPDSYSWGVSTSEQVAEGIQGNKSKTFADSAVGTLVGWIKKAYSKIYAGAFEWGFTTTEKISAGAESARPVVESSFDKLVGWAGSSYAKAFTDAYVWGSKTVDELSKGAESKEKQWRDRWAVMKKIAKDAMIKLIADVVVQASLLPSKIGAGIANASANVRSGIGSLINVMAAALESGINNVISGLNKVLSYLNVPTIGKVSVPRASTGGSFAKRDVRGGVRAMAEGSIKGVHRGGPALVGEEGPELAHIPNKGMTIVGQDGPEVRELPRGTSVLPNPQTEEMLNTYHFPAYANGVGDYFDKYIASPAKAVKNYITDNMSWSNPLSGFGGDVVGGAVSKAKSEAISYASSKVKEFFAGDGGGGNVKASFGNLTKTSSYGMRFHPIFKTMRLHAGDDYAGKIGTAIKATIGGKVVSSGPSGTGWGTLVKIQNGIYSYIYAHLSKAMAKVGSMVGKGNIIGLLGNTGNSTGPHLHYEVHKNGRPVKPNGYARGGEIRNEQIIRVGEQDKAEMIIPLEQHKERARSLWKEAGDRLGMFKYYEVGGTIGRKLPSTYTVKNGDTMGELAEKFDTSVYHLMQVNKQIKNANKIAKGQKISLSKLIQVEDGSFVSPSFFGGKAPAKKPAKKTPAKKTPAKKTPAKKTTPKKTTAKKETKPVEKPDAAYKSDSYSLNMDKQTTAIALIEDKMENVTKESVKYRDSLKKVIAHKKEIEKLEKAELKRLEKRQATIKKELAKLPSLGKQTAAQREKYNSLKQEYDENQGKINGLKQSISDVGAEIKAKSAEIFTNFVGEIMRKYDEAMSKIEQRIDTIDFKIDEHNLKNPDDKKKLLNLQGDKATEAQKAQATAQNKFNEASKRYDEAVKKYGKWSTQAVEAWEHKHASAESLEDAKIAVLQAEKEIKDIRASIADEGIAQLKDYYGKMKDMATSAIDSEIEALKKAHDKKIKLLDDESERINKVYDDRLKAMDDQRSAEDYNRELAEKNASKATLVNKISLLSRDTSLDGRKKLAELQAELATAEQEIADFTRARQDELQKESIEAQRVAQLDKIEKEKEAEQVILDGKVDSLEAQKLAVQKHYDDILNNDKYWADMRNQAILGNFTTLNTELGKMKTNIDNMNKGIFNGLIGEFKNVSGEVMKEIKKLYALDIDNLIHNSKEPISDGKEAAAADPYKETKGSVPSTGGTKVTPPKQTTPAPAKTPAKPAPAKPAPKPSTGGTATEYYTIKKGDTFSEIEQRYKLPYGSLQKLNPKLNPTKLKIGQKIVLRKGSSSGGGTGGGSTSKPDRKITSAANFRSKPAYGNNVMSVIPKGAKVDYVGTESGWAKIKYNGKTGYVGPSYLQKFDTGGYTGKWAGGSGKVAMLHSEETILNKKESNDFVNASKLLETAKQIVPTPIKRNSVANMMASKGVTVTNNVDIDVEINVENLSGSKADLDRIAKQVGDKIYNEMRKGGL